MNKNEEITISCVNNLIEESLKLKTQDYKVDSKIMWNSWSLWKKLLYRSIRRLYCAELQMWNLYTQELDNALYCGNHTTEYVGNAKNAHRKWWYQNNPKSILLCDILIKPIKPLEYIKMDFVIKGKK
jgi:hypothetical protein